jgi:hypothetical protein
VVVYNDGGQTVVAAIDAARMLSVVGNPRLEPIAAEVSERLRKVVESVR